MATIAIYGYGLEGKSTEQFLLRQGVAATDIFIIDDTDPEIDYGRFKKADQIFLTPGITLSMLRSKVNNDELYEEILPKLTSQTHYFFEHYTGIVIGITGTKGKSTISTLTYELLKRAGKSVQLVGNVGKPVLDEIDWTTPPDIVVYEMSSFMIEKLYGGNHKIRNVDIAIFNTLYPAHTKEHGGYEPYALSKLKLLEHASYALIGEQVARTIREQFPKTSLPLHTEIYGASGDRTWSDGVFRYHGEPVATDEGMLLLGEHNRQNACAVLAVAHYFAIDAKIFEATLQTFSGLEHRLEYVGMYHQIKRYNDAIATTPQATLAAIESFGDQLGTIFLGGIEGDYQFDTVVAALEKYGVRNIVLFPDTGARIKQLLDPVRHQIFETRSMTDAVTRAAENTKPNMIVLLSCGSPSFSLRASYKEKGAQFIAAVKKLA